MTIHALQCTSEMQCGRQVTSQNKQKKSGDPILHLASDRSTWVEQDF